LAPGIIIQARLTSTRFPNKVLYPLLDKPVLQWVIEACEKSELPFVIAIPSNKTDKGIKSWLDEWCKRTNRKIRLFEGHKDDLLLRFIQCNKLQNFDPIIRINGNSSFVSPEDIKLALEIYNKRKYFTILNHVQVFGKDELEYADKNNPFIASREHVVGHFCLHTVDYPEDVDRLEREWREGSPTMDKRKKILSIK